VLSRASPSAFGAQKQILALVVSKVLRKAQPEGEHQNGRGLGAGTDFWRRLLGSESHDVTLYHKVEDLMKTLVLVFFALSASLMAQSNPARFAPAVTYGSGGDQARWAAVADLNGDSKPDLLIVNECGSSGNTCSTSTVAVLLGNGNGTFQPAVSYLTGGHGLRLSGGYGSISVAVADVNGDGRPDLVVANACSGNNCLMATGDGTLGVLFGNGDGTFQPVVLYDSGAVRTWTVAVADVNGDGKPDLVAANECGSTCTNGTLGVLLGNGNGTFQPAVTYGSGGFDSRSMAVADVNGDGKLDMIVTNLCPVGGSICVGYSMHGTVGVLLGNGNGTFQAALVYDSGEVWASSVAVADVNGDGKPDIVVANECGGAAICFVQPIAVLLGNGNGTFRSAVTYGPGGYAANSVAVADVNGDGKPDIVVVNYGTSIGNGNGTLGVLLGNGDGTFQPAVAYGSGGTSADSVAVADVNGDGKPDMLAANFCSSSVNCTNGVVASASVLINTTP
jgi:hypothetical protein